MITPQNGKSKVNGENREIPLSPIHAASKWMPAPSSVEEAAGKKLNNMIHSFSAIFCCTNFKF
jgi:hypothetical protein